MKFKISTLLGLALAVAVGLTSCSKDEPENQGAFGGGDYGNLNGNIITVGATRDVTYTDVVLLGTVDFPKLTSDHTFGIVYMEALTNPNFDYEEKLVCDGQSGKNDKEKYVCTSVQVNSSSVDGKFEKQLIDLKPATTYYYRAYVKIGKIHNYSQVKSVTTKDPSPEITLATLEATDLRAVKAAMKGGVNVGNLQDVNENQKYGFIYTDEVKMSTAETLTYEYYEQWQQNHFDTEDDFDEPDEITTKENLNGRITCEEEELEPGKTYYYRTFFAWNGKYFYAPEVKSFKTLGAGSITVNTGAATEIEANSATLNGSFPISLVGIENVKAGFLISSKYSHASAFKVADAKSWYNKNQEESDVYYIQTSTTEKDYSIYINNLDPETNYYVVGYIYMGYDSSWTPLRYDDEDDDPYIIYGNVQRFKTDKVPANETLQVSSLGTYPWRELSDGTWESGNAGVNSTTSTLTISFTPRYGEKLCFDLDVSSESGWDYVVVKGTNWTSDQYSGTEQVRYESPVYTSTQPTSVTVTYKKDSSGSSGRDTARVSNITLEQ